MLSQQTIQENGHQPSTLRDAYLDFILSRKAMLCTQRTIKFYKDTLTKLIEWLEGREISDPSEITNMHIRAFLNSYAERGCSDSYIHTYARSTRTFVRFLLAEKYIPELLVFEMPRIGRKHLPVLSVEEVKKILKACKSHREKSLILLMVDTGLRRAEVCSLNWGDIDLNRGICIVHKGKGNKARSVILGIKTRRELLKYRIDIESSGKDDPLIQTKSGKRFTHSGFRSLLLRLSEKSEVQFSAHALRRTFVVLSLRGGMSLAHVQAFMGHSSPKMTLHYASLVDDDLIVAHREHGPVDNFLQY